MLFASFLFGLVLYFFKGIPVIIGLLFVVLLLVFVWALILNSRRDQIKVEINDKKTLENASNDSLLRSIFVLLLGVVLLKYGADFLVYSTKNLAKSFGVSDRVIAVTIVAIGTSLPELATSIVAALKREENLAVGNLIGSNLFNILAVLGITASLKAINIDDQAIFSFDYLWMMFITLLFGFFIYVFSKKEISRKEGFILLLIYMLYLYKTLV